MAGMSMWGAGSNYDGGYMHPMMTGQGVNPFDSPGSDQSSLRPPTFYPPYAQPPSMLGMGAPRNSILSNMGGYGNMPVQNRMSTFSLATTANPFAGGPALMPSPNPNPSEEEVLGVLRRYLASQDLMTV